MSIPALAQLFWNKANMRNVKMQIDKQPYKSAYDALIKKADLYLLEPHLSVVNDKDHIPASGDIHDYMSIGRYTWPDTTKADGLPYIERDGYTNPEYYTYDREVLLKMVDRVKTFTLAWYFSDDSRYASAAVGQIRPPVDVIIGGREEQYVLWADRERLHLLECNSSS